MGIFSRKSQKQLGRSARWLRDHWVLTGLTALGGVALVLRTMVYTWLWVLFGILAAFAVVLDRVADWYDTKENEWEEEAERSAVNNALTALLGLLDNTREIAFLEGAARTAEINSFRSQLAQSAAIAPTASGIRASCYQLTYDAEGWRELHTPKSRGRADEASTEFFEQKDPDHPIWTMMSARDSDCTIYEAPDEQPRVDWSSKPYKTFVSVPIKADGVVFGMLSVNAPQVGDLSEVDRLTVIAMARVTATTLAMNEGPRKLKTYQESSGSVETPQGGTDA